MQAASVAGELRAKPSAATAPEPVGDAVAEPVEEPAAQSVKKPAKQVDADATATTENGDTAAWPPDTARASGVQKAAAAKLLQPVVEQPVVEQPVVEQPVVDKMAASKPEVTAGAGIGAAPAGVMVQIAAISNAGDADVLVRALGRHGYAPAVRKDAADGFLHVQVGPFASRGEAKSMQQKLLRDGYNAILKQ